MGCEGLVESAVRSLEGVVVAKASYRQGTVVVEYEPDKVAPEQIMGAINTQTYYRATGVVEGGEGAAEAVAEQPSAEQTATAVIWVQGMRDERAASTTMAAMGRVGGIINVSVDLEDSTLTVEYDPQTVRAEELVGAIGSGTSYKAAVLSTTEAGEGPGAVARTFDYATYIVWGVAGLFAFALGWSGLSWARRRWAQAGASQGARRRAGRRQKRR